MKLSIKFFAVFAFTLLSSTCKKEPAGIKKTEVNSPFGISVNEKVLISESNILFELTEVADNRCPADVQCFSAGDAKVKLNITGLDTRDTVINFCIGQCESRYREADTAYIQHEKQEYSLILSEIHPYPGTGSEKKTAVFTLKKN